MPGHPGIGGDVARAGWAGIAEQNTSTTTNCDVLVRQWMFTSITLFLLHIAFDLPREERI
jgi:hypothetical protein